MTRLQHMIVFRGPAGVGKSALAVAVRERLGYPTAAIDTDLFNWTVVPGESNERVVFDIACSTVEAYLRYGYNVILSGLILTSEEDGALESLRGKSRLLGACYHDIFCSAPEDVVQQRAAGRNHPIPAEQILAWWKSATEDVQNIGWPVVELDMTRPLNQSCNTVLDLITSAETAA